jgi:hypothetical protein
VFFDLHQQSGDFTVSTDSFVTDLHRGIFMAEKSSPKSPVRHFKLGRRRPVARGPRLSLKNYLLRLAAPVAPPTADYSAAAMPELNNIYLNDQLGDCVIAAGYHMVAVATGNTGG